MWVQACMVNIPFFISILYLYVWPFARRNDVHLHESTRLSGVHEALESALKGATGVHLMGTRWVRHPLIDNIKGSPYQQ